MGFLSGDLNGDFELRSGMGILYGDFEWGF